MSRKFKMAIRNRHIQVKDLYSYINTKDRQVLLIPILAIISAEMLIYSGHLLTGAVLHVITVLLLSLSVMWAPGSHVSRSFQVLALLPLIRLLNISIPVFSEVTLYYFIFIYLPLLLPAYVIIKHQDRDLSHIGLTSRRLPVYIPLSILVGGIMGWGESMIIDAGNLIPDLSFASLLRLSLVMILIVGFTEELIFRSLLQTRMEDSFGKAAGLLIASLLFGVMHSGYGTFNEILYTFLMGIVLGYMFRKTGSLPLVSLTHGFVNIFLFGLIPLLPYF
jgi:membrane protease YdiL (CAAX protease family)